MLLSKYLDRLKKFSLTKFKYSDINFIFKLGEGATGSVYKCKINKIDYAVKIFDIENYINLDGLIDDVYNEIYISDLLKDTIYSNIFYGISVYNKLDDVKIYLVSNYYKKSLDLRDFISNNYCRNNYILDKSDKISIIRQLIFGLEEINKCKVLHCDIKPENVIIYKKNNSYNIKYIDFGGSCYLNSTIFDSSHYDYNFGTVGYMSKEVHNKNIYFSSEIYSLFVCILEVLVGKIWSDGTNYKNCRKEVLNSISKIENKQIKNYIKLGLSENIERPSIKNISTDFINLLQQLA
jgi:serine/threonine protein kinase